MGLDSAPSLSAGYRVARASALLCWIFWTTVHAARTDLPLLQVDRPRPDRFDKSSLHHAAELPTPPPFAGGARRRHAQPALGTAPTGTAIRGRQVCRARDRSRSTRELQRISTSTKSRVCETQLTPPLPKLSLFIQ